MRSAIMRRFSRCLLPLLVTPLVTAQTAAQISSGSLAAEVPMELRRLSGPITLDGHPDEAAWQQVPPLPLTMYSPVFKGRPTQRTEIRVAYDDEFFYAAGWFYDTDPSGIRINSLYRDRWNGDDAFAIYIDAFNDNQTAKWFGTTPAGMRFDLLVSDDGNTTNENWDAFWIAKTSVNEQGWFAEVRIPFSTLGFHTAPDGRAMMGLTVTRLVSRLEERVTFPEIDPKFPFRRPSVAQDVVMRGVRSRTPLYVTPYVLGGASRNYVAVRSGTLEWQRDTSKEIGLDVRYPLSGTLTLDLTVNTDFAQVEADGQQIALDRFPLFYPERRRFFQEASSIFDFTGANGTRLFHSRRIGLTLRRLPSAPSGAEPMVHGRRDADHLRRRWASERRARRRYFAARPRRRLRRDEVGGNGGRRRTRRDYAGLAQLRGREVGAAYAARALLQLAVHAGGAGLPAGIGIHAANRLHDGECRRQLVLLH